MIRGEVVSFLLLFVAAFSVSAEANAAGDWPMWRYDPSRSGASPLELPGELHLQWQLELPTPAPAWPSNQEKLQFDRLYEPVVAGKLLFVPSMISDKVVAYDTDTGTEKWTFYTNGPVRFAPLVWRNNLYIHSDDGYLYCLDAAQGQLKWKFRGGPSERLVLGQDRLISTWPARGGVLVYEDTLYFGAGIWPFQGIFLYALEPDSGAVVWANTGTGSDYFVQQHGSPAFAGVAPQGYIAATKERLVVSGGKTMPAVFDRQSGELLHFNLSSRAMGSKGGGGYEVTVGKDFYLNRDEMYRLSDGTFVARVGAPVLTTHGMMGAHEGGLIGYKPGWRVSKATDRRGNEIEKLDVVTEWTARLEETIDQVFIQSGNRVYCTGDNNSVLAVELPMRGRGARVAWKVLLPDEPLNMIAADDKLFVTTGAGRIYAFGATPKGQSVSPLQKVTLHRARPRFEKDAMTETARRILQESDVREGYCFALGLATGRLVEEIVSQSDLHVVVVEKDAEKVDAFRRRMDALGIYGSRVAVRVDDPASAQLPPYAANLVVSEAPGDAGLALTKAVAARLLNILRPYNGVAQLSFGDEAASFATLVDGAKLHGASVESRDEWVTLRRLDAPQGAGNWTHQYGDAANSVAANDVIVKPPLGLLWFGGPSNEEILPRHGHGPTPQVVEGRVIIEGRNILRAVDSYTGRLLWQRDFPDLGRYYDYVSHEPGANLIGSNYVSLPDGVYVVYDKRCLRLDPDTGETTAEFFLPQHAEDPETPDWGYIGIWGDVIIAGAKPTEFTTAAYKFWEMRRYVRLDGVERMKTAFNSLHGFVASPPKPGEDPLNWVFRNANKLLMEEDMLGKIPAALRREKNTLELEKQLATYLAEAPERTTVDEAALDIKREILALCFNLPRDEKRVAGLKFSFKRAASRSLVAMDRHTGKVLWQFDSRHEFRHNTIALGGGKVFCMDRIPAVERNFLERRGIAVQEEPQIVALDIRSGKVLWRHTDRIFGTWLGYSTKHDALLQAGSKSGDRAQDEIGKGMVMYDGTSGKVLWQNDLEYAGPCILLGDRLITQGYRDPGFALDIRTGQQRMRAHPISGEEIPWQYFRNYGCNTAIGSPNLLTFRSAAAGYYDLSGDSGTGNFGGFRAGCTTNLIPAGGVLNAPDYTRTCTCSYQNQASLALVNAPEVEMWTFNGLAYDARAVSRAGINFGAPGDRRGPDGTLWLDFPSVGGKSPDIPAEVFGEDVQYLRQHPSEFAGEELGWVAASALRGAEEIVVQVVPEAIETVRNEVAGGAPLRVTNATHSPSVPWRAVTGNGPRNTTSLAKADRAQAMEATIATYPGLRMASVTTEYWVRASSHFAHVDSRGRNSGAQPLRQGFAIDGLVLRARYFVSNARHTAGEAMVQIETSTWLPKDRWAHVAFTYDAQSGVGRLYLDGELVGVHDGPDERPLWWESAGPTWSVGDGDNDTVAIDELRVSSTALEPEQLLVAAGPSAPPESMVGYWRMEPTMAKDETAKTARYTVRLVFSENEGRQPGERPFDVFLQGKKVLEGFDIAAATDGQRGVVKEFRGVEVPRLLRLRMVPLGGAPPLVSGLQLVAEKSPPETARAPREQ